MLLLVGLGNPGSQYARHRHNIGFMAVDALAEVLHAGPWKQKYNGLLAEASVKGEKLLLLKPQTMMNRSGTSVSPCAQFYKLAPSGVFVFHDELDLPLGKIRVKQGGGNGGHNGLRDIDAHFGKDYWRVRIGIGHPGHKEAVTGHVLGNFSPDEQPLLEDVLDTITRNIDALLEGKPELFMSRVAEALAKSRD